MKNMLLIVMSLLVFVSELCGAIGRLDVGLSEQFCRTMPPVIVQSVYMGDRYSNPKMSGGDNELLNVGTRLSLRKKVAPVNFTTPTKNILVQDRCDSLAYQNIKIGQAAADGQNWFTRFWVKTDYLSEHTIPAKIGHDEFVWTIKKSRFKGSGLDLVVTCEYPTEGYIHPRLAQGSWMFSPQLSVPWSKPKR